MGQGKECVYNSEGMEDTGIRGSTESTKRESYGLIKTKEADAGHAEICTRSFANMLWLLVWYFVGCLTLGIGVSLTPLPSPGTILHLVVCFVQH